LLANRNIHVDPLAQIILVHSAFPTALLLEVSEGVCAWRNLIVPDGRVDDANRVRVELVAEVHLRVTRAVLPQGADEQLPQRVVRATLHGILSAAAEFS
jgi:hypothetical protein